MVRHFLSGLVVLWVLVAAGVMARSVDSAPKSLKAPFTEAEAEAAQLAWAKHLKRDARESIDLGGGVKLEVVLIPPGTFLMGSPKTEKQRNLGEINFDSEAQHEVTITRPFYLGKYEVTQAQFKEIVFDHRNYNRGERLPVESVTWDEAVAFCKELKVKGGRASLPTEAEWEYACRAGTTTPFSFGGFSNGSQANCDGEVPYGTGPTGPYLKKTCEVGKYTANPFGLYDMHGNVWEWCTDYYGPYSAIKNPADPVQLTKREEAKEFAGFHILRGGGWYVISQGCRAAVRLKAPPDYRDWGNGFRVCVRLE